MTKQAGKEAVHKLIDDFEKNESQYMSKSFQEAETRSRFIDPFFAALGWDFQQTDIAKKLWDVHREFSQRDNSVTKKPDYAFRVKEGVKYREKFFVEAKAPHVDLEGNIPVFQAKRYAFSSHGKTPIAILTDFQTFRVFNGLEKPVFENPLQGLIKGFDLEYHEYLDRWDALWDAFSKEAVAEGSIERLIGKVGRNVKSLDDEFLADISAWRELLARNVAIRNKDLSVDHINEAVQRILDRLIFIRNLEDRGIESEEGLLFFTNVKEGIYLHLISLFKKFDVEYNGQLFKEYLSEAITVDDPTIKGIIKQLYPPKSPYAFDMIEPEILGRIYERFLGSKIRLTESHQAKVEEKPEVRHAGGVYYTPQYIVDYIVENTLGVKIKDKTPEEISSVKICDPACGSGSFLLGAFQYLIEYHREWYAKADVSEQKKYRNDFYTNADNEIQLTHKKKSEILTNNIFGVDIDREAVEVAIMSLYLKLLDEGQTEMYLPDITENIKCGNSLIGTDFYAQSGLDLRDDDKLNCFDWDGKDGFTEIIKNGGFDVVIGNPPYVLLENENRNDEITNYARKNYIVACSKIDLYHLFIEKSFRLLRNDGKAAMIVPANFISNNGLAGLRDFLICKTNIHEILNIKGRVFLGASVNNAIFAIGKDTPGDSFNFKEASIDDSELIITNQYTINSNDVINDANHLFSNTEYKEIFKKIDISSRKLTEIAFVNFGKQLRDRKIYKKDVITIKHDESVPAGYAKCYTGKDVQKYHLKWDGLACMISTKAKQGGCWDEDKQNGINKLITKQIGVFPEFAIDIYGYQCLNTVFFVNIYEAKISPCFLLGVLNSKLIKWIWVEKYYDKRTTFPKIKGTYLKELPIPSLDLSQKSEKAKHDALVSLVDKMLDLKQKEAAEKSDHLKTVISRKIEVIDKAIDTAVYELYNLTADEINVVEGKE